MVESQKVLNMNFMSIGDDCMVKEEYLIYVDRWWTYIACYFIYHNMIPPLDISIYLALDEEVLKGIE